MTDNQRPNPPWWERFPASRAGHRTGVATVAVSFAVLAVLAILTATGPGRHATDAAFAAAAAAVAVISGTIYLASRRHR